MNAASGALTVAGLSAFVAAGLLGSNGIRTGGSAVGVGPRWQRHRGSPAPGSRGPSRMLSGGRRPAGVVDRGRREAARWATTGDLRALLLRHRRPGGRTGAAPVPPGRLVLGRTGRRLVASERAQSVIVFGPTQSRKTSGFAIPAILEWDGPVLASSVKTDLIEHTAGHRATRGTVSVFDPSASTGLVSATWSPVSASCTWPGARRAASSLTEVAKTSVGTMSDGDFWYATATRMLAPMLFAAAVGRRDITDVIRWVDTQEQAEVLDLLAAAGVPEALHAARSAFGKEERQRSSIYTTVEMILEPLAGGEGGGGSRGDAGGPEESGGSVDPSRLVAGSNTLYLCAPAHDQRRLTPLFVSVVRQVVEHVFDRVATTGRPLDPPLLMVLDEAANIAPLSDLDALASTAAGHGIQLVTVWHDLAQINARYGPRATTVVNNHRSKLFLSGISDPATLDYASHLIGDEEPLLPATTSGGSNGPSTTRSPSVRRLAPAGELRRIAPGHAVLLHGSLPPARLTLRTWFDDPALAARAASPPPRPAGAGPGAAASVDGDGEGLRRRSRRGR